MDLAGFQYDPVSLDVNKVWFGEELHIPNMRENQEKVKSLLNGAVTDTDFECLSCGKVEAVGYFQLSDMTYNDRNALTKKLVQ